jgi:hypothetical protein
MGVDYRGLAVVGIRVKKSDLTITTRVKAFPHNHPEHWKVDPVTGKDLWGDRRASVFGEDFEYGYDKLPGGLQTFSGSGYDDDPEIFIGRGISTDSNRSGGDSAKLDIDVDDLDKIAKALHKLLDPLNLNIDITSSLGIWAALSVS